MGQADSRLDAWGVSEADFPEEGSADQKLRSLVAWASLAPSGHNSQPWLFRVREEQLELIGDKRRALPVVDPDDRELVMSCGAALFHLRIALRHFGYLGEIRTLHTPDRHDTLAPVRHIPDVLARVRLGDPHEPTARDEELFFAIKDRRTVRARFEDRLVPATLLEELRHAAEREGAWLEVVEAEEARTALADLVAEGDRIQGSDPRFRRELAAWIHPNRTRSRDGMPGYAFGLRNLASYVGPLVVRTFDWGEGQAARDRQLAEGSPVLAVLGTHADLPPLWLAAGQALDHVLLRAAAEGVGASYLNQPIELPELRSRVAEILETDGHPQLLLRMGYGPRVKPTPRRPAEEVLV